MDLPRPVTLFPTRAGDLETLGGGILEQTRDYEDTTGRSRKRRLESQKAPISFKLSSSTVEPSPSKLEDPNRYYAGIYKQERTWIAQEVASPYRVVGIKRSHNREVFRTNHKNLLNVLNSFYYNGSLFTVFDRPEITLAQVFSCPMKPGEPEIATITKEVLQAVLYLEKAGFLVRNFDIKTIFISEHDGFIKLAIDKNIVRASKASEASALGQLLVSMMEPHNICKSPFQLLHPSKWTSEARSFLRNTSHVLYNDLQDAKFLSHSPSPKTLARYAIVARQSAKLSSWEFGDRLEEIEES